MATPVSSVPEFCAAIARSKLLSEADVMKVREKWTAAAGANDSDLDGFRKLIVRENYLTEYQAALIQRGRSEGFAIGEYVILDRIGSGQTAGVYKAIHNSGQLVALKVLPASKAKDQHTLNRFEREGRLLTQLEHPNTVRAYQVGRVGGVHFIAMEHLEGETLDQILERRKKLPSGEAVRLILQALEGLQHLHEKRMIHRDLKPMNLMVTPATKGDTLSATLKILDIGLGRELFDENSPATQDLHLTGEGALLGTPDYLAPEQARDARATDIRADIYSLGCALYHLLAGRTPFVEKNIMAQMVKHATEKPQPVSNFAPEVPFALAKALEKLLEKKPEDRPMTPSDAAALLKPFLPSNATRAESTAVVPAYRQWLESESAMELPSELKSALLKPAAPPVARALPMPVPLPAALPEDTAPLRPVATKAKPAADSKPVAKPAAPPPLAAKVTYPAPVAPPIPAPAPQFINVELVDLPRTNERDDEKDEDEEEEEEDRPLYRLDRRDWLMLGLGGFAMLFAIVVGFGLTRLTAPSSTAPTDAKP